MATERTSYMKLFIFENVRDTKTNPLDVSSIAELGNIVKQRCTEELFDRCKEDKQSQPAILMYKPKNIEENQRKLENVETKQDIPIDIDCDAKTLAYFKELYSALGEALYNKEMFVYPSYSCADEETGAGFRYRVFLTWDKPLNVNDYRKATKAFIKELQEDLTKRLEHMKAEQGADWDIDIKLDDCSEKPSQVMMFGTCKKLTYDQYMTLMRFSEGAPISSEEYLAKAKEQEPTTSKNSSQSKKKQAPITQRPFIERETYVDTVLELIEENRWGHLEDLNNYNRIKISVFSDFYYGAINEDTVIDVLVTIAFGNEDYVRRNIQAFQDERKNFSQAVLEDKGLYALAEDLRIKKEMRVSEAFQFEEKYKDNEVSKITLKANINALAYEFVQDRKIIYQTQPEDTFYRFDKAWLPVDIKDEFLRYLNELVRDFSQGKVAFTNLDGTRLYTKERAEALLKKELTVQAILSTRGLKFKKHDIIDTVQLACSSTEEQEVFRDGTTIYDVMSANKIAFSNGTLTIHKNGTFEFEENWNPKDYCIILVRHNFMYPYLSNDIKVRVKEDPFIIFHSDVMKDIKKAFCSTSKREDAMQRVDDFYEFMTEFCEGDIETVHVLLAFFGMCAFPKPEFSQKTLILKSQGGSGKSKLSKYLFKLIGTQNTVTTTFEEMFGKTSQFNKANILNKTGAHIDECDFKGSESAFKNITGTSGNMSFEKKGKQAFQAPITANFVCSTNLRIQMSDTGTSMKRRICVYETSFNYETQCEAKKARWELSRFITSNDEGIEDALITYLVFEYILELRKRAKNVGDNNDSERRFMNSERMLEIGDELWSDLDPVGEFMKSMMIVVDDPNMMGESVKEAFLVFQRFCDYHGYIYATDLSQPGFETKCQNDGYSIVNCRDLNGGTIRKKMGTVEAEGIEFDFTGSSAKGMSSKGKRFKQAVFIWDKLEEFCKDYEEDDPNTRQFVPLDLEKKKFIKCEVSKKRQAEATVQAMVQREKNAPKGMDVVFSTHCVDEEEQPQEEIKEVVVSESSTELDDPYADPRFALIDMQKEFEARNAKDGSAMEYLTDLNLGEDDIAYFLAKGVFEVSDPFPLTEEFLRAFCQPCVTYSKTLEQYKAEWKQNQFQTQSSVDTISQNNLDNAHVMPDDNPCRPKIQEDENGRAIVDPTTLDDLTF